MDNDTHGAPALAETLVAELAGVADWPKMALHFSRAIDSIRSHERARLVYLQRIADRDRRIAGLEAEVAAWRAADTAPNAHATPAA